jgi:hypothetical protein
MSKDDSSNESDIVFAPGVVDLSVFARKQRRSVSVAAPADPVILRRPTALAKAVVKVGSGGRGFVVKLNDRRYVITAAHCLPRSRWPYPILAHCSSDAFLPKMIGALDAKSCSISAEFCVVSLTDDLAVLGEPDNQAFGEAADQYEVFTQTAALTIGKPPTVAPAWEWNDVPAEPAFVLSLDRERWIPCTVRNIAGRHLTLAGAKIDGGMSGSPILNASGQAIGLISTGNGLAHGDNCHPSLRDCLPPWLLRKVGAA